MLNKQKYSVLMNLLQDRVNHLSTHFDDSPYNFGPNPNQSGSADIVKWISDVAPEFCEPLHIIPGHYWALIIRRHFRPTGTNYSYVGKITDNEIYDGSAKIGDRPLTHREIMDRLVRI